MYFLHLFRCKLRFLCDNEKRFFTFYCNLIQPSGISDFAINISSQVTQYVKDRNLEN